MSERKKLTKQRHCAKCRRNIAAWNKSGLCNYHHAKAKNDKIRITKLVKKYKSLETAEIQSKIIEDTNELIPFILINQILNRKKKTHTRQPMKLRDKLVVLERLEGNTYD